MAKDNLQTDAALATPKLALELEDLWKRVQRLESLLRGAESVLSVIH